MAAIRYTLCAALALSMAPAGAQTVTTLLRSGSAGAKLNLVIVGDGFRAHEQATFNRMVDAIVMRGCFARGVIQETMNAFNIYRTNVDSIDSGVTQVDANGKVTTSRRTALDYRYSGVWSRCWMEPGKYTGARLQTYVYHRVPQVDYVFIVLNETGTGGCRRGSTLAVTRSETWDVCAHEMGHMVANLGDEYFDATSPTYTGGEPSYPNLTTETDRSRIKWRDYIPPQRPVPTRSWHVTSRSQDVGLFEGGTLGTRKFRRQLYRPTFDSRMRSNLPAFCPVGHEAWRRAVRNQHEHHLSLPLVGDFNGDGRDDVVLHNANSLALYLSDGAQLELRWIRTGPIPRWDQIRGRDRFLVGDFNGDGKDDLYVYNRSDWSTNYLGLLRSTGTGFVCDRIYATHLPGWYMSDRDRYHVGDFNGDGKADLMVFNGLDWSTRYLQLFTSAGNALTFTRRYTGGLPGWGAMARNDKFFVGDFDGDRRDDLYVFNAVDWGDHRYLSMLRSTGSGLAHVVRYDDDIPGWGRMARHDRFVLADFNGDKRQDLFVFNGVDWRQPYFGRLASSGRGLGGGYFAGSLPGWGAMRRSDQLRVGDVDGDGRDDVYVYNAWDWGSRKYLGMLRSTSTGFAGRTVEGRIGSWELSKTDSLAVANFSGGAGWDDLIIRNRDRLGLFQSYGGSLLMRKMYPDYIRNLRYHRRNWW